MTTREEQEDRILRVRRRSPLGMYKPYGDWTLEDYRGYVSRAEEEAMRAASHAEKMRRLFKRARDIFEAAGVTTLKELSPNDRERINNG